MLAASGLPGHLRFRIIPGRAADLLDPVCVVCGTTLPTESRPNTEAARTASRIGGSWAGMGTDSLLRVFRPRSNRPAEQKSWPLCYGGALGFPFGARLPGRAISVASAPAAKSRKPGNPKPRHRNNPGGEAASVRCFRSREFWSLGVSRVPRPRSETPELPAAKAAPRNPRNHPCFGMAEGSRMVALRRHITSHLSPLT